MTIHSQSKGVLVYVTAPGREEWRDLSLFKAEEAAHVAGVKFYYHEGTPKKGFELGALSDALERFPEAKEFLVVQDTIIIKDYSKVVEAFNQLAGRFVVFAHHGQSYFCKYRREVLEEIGIPLPKDKYESIEYENSWTNKYFSKDLENIYYCTPVLRDGDCYETVFGLKRMILENDWFKKIKSVWNPNMVAERCDFD